MYLMENTNIPINSEFIETVIKLSHIFNNLSLTFRPRVIKISPNFNMVIVQIDIWDVQSGKNAKMLINRYFNVRSHITTIHRANINSSVPQCKNCQKWGHTTFVCRIQGSKCVKCNSPHKIEYHQHFIWCCKLNFKINLPRLETKQGELYPYHFKCFNCKGNYQADFNLYLFWKNQFNKEWHTKKYQEICDNRNKSTHSSMSGIQE